MQFYLEKNQPEEDIRHQIGLQLPRFLQWNDQVSNRLLDHILCCIPYLPVQDVVTAVLDSTAPSPSQQKSYVDCLVTLLKASANDQDRARQVWSLLWNRQSEQLVTLALEKWNENATGEVEVIADVIWSFLHSHSSDTSAVFSCFIFCILLHRDSSVLQTLICFNSVGC